MKAIFIILTCVMLGSGACTNTTNKQTKVVKKQYKYICTMHPGTGSDKPGVCAKCGMQLVERDTDK